MTLARDFLHLVTGGARTVTSLPVKQEAPPRPMPAEMLMAVKVSSEENRKPEDRDRGKMTLPQEC
jgi:hypothetical protein